MPNIVTEQTKLHRDEAQVDRVQQLKPEIVADEQKSDTDDKEAECKESFVGVVGGLLIQ